MAYNPKKHHRRSIRLPGYDYSSPGAYFVTICVRGGECLLGDVVDGEMQLNDWGRIADEFWAQVMVHFANVSIDTFQVMPNHVHAIIVIQPAAAAVGDDQKGEETSPLQGVQGGGDDGRGAVSAPTGCATPPLPMAAGDDRKGEGTSPLQDGPGGGDDCRGAVSAPTGYAAPIDDDVSAVESQLENPTLGQIVGYYKYETAKQINLLRGMPGVPFWQRNYWDHIIRNEASWNRIREYIKNNPGQWEEDQLHPGAPSNLFNQWDL